MVKTIIGGIAVQDWITKYSCRCPPVNGSNSFYDQNGDWVADKNGDEVLLDITLEDVPTPVSVALAEALKSEKVTVDYTTPLPQRSTFYKTAYTADCEDADPDETDFDCTDGIKWNINLSLRSAGLITLPGGL